MIIVVVWGDEKSGSQKTGHKILRGRLVLFQVLLFEAGEFHTSRCNVMAEEEEESELDRLPASEKKSIP